MPVDTVTSNVHKNGYLSSKVISMTSFANKHKHHRAYARTEKIGQLFSDGIHRWAVLYT